MNARLGALRAGADQIGAQIVPHSAYRDQKFWCLHWPALRELVSIKAIIQERLIAFEQHASRTNAISLIVFNDLAWQVIRELGSLRGSDRDWIKKTWLRQSEDASNAFDLLLWCYEMHSALRHPTSNWSSHSWLLDDIWPEIEARRLTDATRVICRLLLIIDAQFNPGVGFEGEIIEKRVLAAIAADHWKLASRKPTT